MNQVKNATISKRQMQKKRSRDNNDITTMQCRGFNKKRLKSIVDKNGFASLDEALDEVLTHYEESYDRTLINRL